MSLQIYSCVGNEAKVVSGDAKGAIGYVIGHHGGSEHVIVDFPKSRGKAHLRRRDHHSRHGPGVTTIMTCKTSLIEPVIDPQANIADLLGIGTAAKAT